jgi:hypothetical protein
VEHGHQPEMQGIKLKHTDRKISFEMKKVLKTRRDVKYHASEIKNAQM